MSDEIDPTRKPALDEEADGLDCFATEGVVVVDTADDRGALVPAPPTSLTIQRIAPWYQWTREPWVRRFVFASALLAFGVLALWLTEKPADQPAKIVAEKPAPAPVVAPAAQSVPPIARPVSEPPVARAIEPPRTTASAATPRTTTPIAPVPARRPSSLPVASPAPAASSEALARPIVPPAAPAPAERTAVVATPEVVKAEPALDAPPAAAAVSAIVASTDRASIERVLEAYRDAYDRLDAPSAAVIWPRVDTRALNRAFSTLAQQDVSFERCAFDIDGMKANATCTGEIRYVRRVGDQAPRTRKLSWQFALERVSDRWQIAQVTAD